MFLVNTTTCSWKQFVFESALNESLQSFFLNFSSSFFFSGKKNNFKDFPQPQLNTVNLCAFLIPQTYLLQKTCQKNCTKAQEFSALHTAEQKIWQLWVLCAKLLTLVIESRTSLSEQCSIDWWVIHKLLYVFSHHSNTLWTHVSIYPLSSNRRMNYLNFYTICNNTGRRVLVSFPCSINNWLNKLFEGNNVKHFCGEICTKR